MTNCTPMLKWYSLKIKQAFGPYKNVAIYINSALFLVNITLDLGVWNDDL